MPKKNSTIKEIEVAIKSLGKTAQANRNKSMAGSSRGEFRINSFFAGIGGFDLGFQRAGIKPQLHCEINKYCNSVLKRHWPKGIYTSDISSLNPADIPDSEVWSGGFPCQDVSVARGWLGRDGLKGKNTGLFYPFAQLVSAKLPTVVIMENVTGLLNSHDGRDFAVILKTFQEIGYGVAWRVLNTRYFGAPQSRPRVYICAWRQSAQSAFNVLFEEGKTYDPEKPRLGFLRPSICNQTGAQVPEVAFCLAATSGRHTGTDWSRSYVAYYNEVRRLTPAECERLQGFPTGWTLPSENFHLTDDQIDTLRYHAIGNAVSVPVVEWVAKRVRSELEAPRTHQATAGRELDFAKDRTPDFLSKKASSIEIEEFIGRDDAPKIKWSRGGVMHEGHVLMAPVSMSPKKPTASTLIKIIDQEKPTNRYFLSPNAATGIIRRVTSQNRELFSPLDLALRRLSKERP